MDQTVLFERSYKERLQKYLYILPENVQAKQVMNEWSLYLQTSIDHFGWQAVWKIPAAECESLNIVFPTLVLVFVNDIQFETLTAEVKVISVQNHINLPENLTANLFNLWPTQEQDDTVCLNLKETSEALDSFRFFYKYLWRPWDTEEYENIWIKNLNPRLKLYYDLKQGMQSKNSRDYYRLQLIESREKYDRFTKILNELQNKDSLEALRKLRDLRSSLENIRRTLELFENPILREKIFNSKSSKSASTNSNFWLVIFSDKEVDEYLEFMENVKAFSNSNCKFQTAISLQNALDLANPNSTIFVGNGLHIVQSSGNLTGGGQIINVDYPKEAIISTTNQHLMFDFKKGEVTLKNLNFKLNSTRYGIRVRCKGSLYLENCSLNGYSENLLDIDHSLLSTQQGIVADTNSFLHFRNCQFSHLSTAVSINTGSVSLFNCKIDYVRCALRMQNSPTLTLYSCQFSRCFECITHLETNEIVSDTNDFLEKGNITGEFSILESFQDTKIGDIETLQISTPEVIITQKLQFHPVRDIFSNPVFNTTLNKTICYDDSD